MSDLQKYIDRRKTSDSEFAKSFDSGYKEFKIGVILREARRKSGLTQEGTISADPDNKKCNIPH